MPRVIEYPPDEKEITCDKCNCKVGYTEGEIKTAEFRVYSKAPTLQEYKATPYETHLYITCPNCSSKIKVEAPD